MSKSFLPSREYKVIDLAAFASMSSTNARGNLIRPSSPNIAPASVKIFTPLGGASARPICSKASRAA